MTVGAGAHIEATSCKLNMQSADDNSGDGSTAAAAKGRQAHMLLVLLGGSMRLADCQLTLHGPTQPRTQLREVIVHPGGELQLTDCRMKGVSVVTCGKLRATGCRCGLCVLTSM